MSNCRDRGSLPCSDPLTDGAITSQHYHSWTFKKIHLRGRERLRETNIDLWFHSCMYAPLAASCVCADWRSSPQPWHMGTTPARGAARPGLITHRLLKLDRHVEALCPSSSIQMRVPMPRRTNDRAALLLAVTQGL